MPQLDAIGAIDLMIGFPSDDPARKYDDVRRRGADKVMYAGYFPMGLSLRRIFDELPSVPRKDEVWPKFLRENALRVFKPGEGT